MIDSVLALHYENLCSYLLGYWGLYGYLRLANILILHNYLS